MYYSFYFFVISLVVNYILVIFLLPVLRKRSLDIPNVRSSHSTPVPRGGGLSFVVTISLVSLMFLILQHFSILPGINAFFSSFALIPLLCLPLAVVGFLDDIFNLHAALRFSVQLLSGFTILLFVASDLPVHLFCFYLVLFPAVVNFVNFMDGLDGLVSGCMIVSISVCLIVLGAPPLSWVYVGPLAGFFLLNWSPAKIFMGDVGSTFLGAIYFSLLISPSSYPDQLSLLLVATPLLGDAASCVVRRFFAGHRVFDAHRLHLYQRLHQAGWSHARVSSLYIAATALLAFALLWGGLPWVITSAALELLLGICLDQQVAVPFSVASRS